MLRMKRLFASVRGRFIGPATGPPVDLDELISRRVLLRADMRRRGSTALLRLGLGIPVGLLGGSILVTAIWISATAASDSIIVGMPTPLLAFALFVVGSVFLAVGLGVALSAPSDAVWQRATRAVWSSRRCVHHVLRAVGLGTGYFALAALVVLPFLIFSDRESELADVLATASAVLSLGCVIAAMGAEATVGPAFGQSAMNDPRRGLERSRLLLVLGLFAAASTATLWIIAQLRATGEEGLWSLLASSLLIPLATALISYTWRRYRAVRASWGRFHQVTKDVSLSIRKHTEDKSLTPVVVAQAVTDYLGEVRRLNQERAWMPPEAAEVIEVLGEAALGRAAGHPMHETYPELVRALGNAPVVSLAESFAAFLDKTDKSLSRV